MSRYIFIALDKFKDGGVHIVCVQEHFKEDS